MKRHCRYCQKELPDDMYFFCDNEKMCEYLFEEEYTLMDDMERQELWKKIYKPV